MTTETPRRTFRVPEKEWETFQKKCASKGYTASDVLRAFIRKVNDNQTTIASVSPERSERGETLMNEDMVLDWLTPKKNL